MGTILSSSNNNWRLLNLPEELQELILSWLDVESLLALRQTCKSLHHILSTDRVWRLVLQRNTGTKNLIKYGLTPNIRLEWQWACLLTKHKPLGRNLLQQPEVLSSWRIVSSGGDGWRLETPPCGTDPIPEETGVSSCFATSYLNCSKEQLVDLWMSGLAPGLLDELQPNIEFGEWYAGRFAVGCIYELKAQLLDADKNKLSELGCREITNEMSGAMWKKICFAFKDYGKGVRYINFYHGGMDTKFLRHYFGIKMVGAYVMVTL